MYLVTYISDLQAKVIYPQFIGVFVTWGIYHLVMICRKQPGTAYIDRTKSSYYTKNSDGEYFLDYGKISIILVMSFFYAGISIIITITFYIAA